jgi:hypothetical protein
MRVRGRYAKIGKKPPITQFGKVEPHGKTSGLPRLNDRIGFEGSASAPWSDIVNFERAVANIFYAERVCQKPRLLFKHGPEINGQRIN